ncbi:MAG: aspartyl-phosphate phosphatase Spo0E family protein [Peptococcaceae bacterium]|nr:aspartyl-phosphate phosphatase Spo0E family protein [Peptococcaceae bacterium]
MEIRLLKRIERLRKELYKFERERKLIDPEVVRVSQQLDTVLNLYYTYNRYQQLSFW